MRVLFNANEQVRVKLNERGVAILKQDHETLQTHLLPKYRREFVLKLDEEGYYRCALWALMQDFGPHMQLGTLPPFDLDIVLGSTQ